MIRPVRQARTTEESPRPTEGSLRDFWTIGQPGLRFSSAEVGSSEFFADVEAHRYSLEPHIPEVVRFERWAGRDVLEAGCGIATDGSQFARAGARYTGVDFSPVAVELARRRFDLEGLSGRFVQGSVVELPCNDESFDLVYSHGVIHHVPETQQAVDEFYRVLRPGGTALVMVYHRGSLNYRFNILVLRRTLAALLLLPGGVEAIARVAGETPELLRAHRHLLRRHGLQYLTDRGLFLSNNTDGPGNPLSKVYSRREARELFQRFADIRLQTRFLNLRVYPGGQRLAATRLARRLERRLGWFLYVEATKPGRP
jgi:ubiquinone/menaquinone biosynthesis C-methylase UbiE